jgi:hypothetical protein
LEDIPQHPLPYQEQEPPPPVIVEGEEQYKVEWVNYSRLVRRQLPYFINWSGYDECSWEHAANMDALMARDDLHTEQPGKPG